ncbi:hypothetical protein GIB67_025372 [Kingdonia uniflora]|uniref:glucose-1-phosphate adenylyltransferase n=1 Tax=Kingdonia uniflora TaxID=39325 RepID=A0A7J7NBL1_9MAGN|nr:hypothetical protein GIB67_025372 [Kingdonia uniflora]
MQRKCNGLNETVARLKVELEHTNARAKKAEAGERPRGSKKDVQVPLVREDVKLDAALIRERALEGEIREKEMLMKKKDELLKDIPAREELNTKIKRLRAQVSHLREYSSACLRMPGQNTPCVIALFASDRPTAWEPQVPLCNSWSISSSLDLERHLSCRLSFKSFRSGLLQLLSTRECSGNYTWGGARTRLYPLIKKRTKPAVPLGENYRLIDIPVSNCLNSNISKTYVLAQFNSASLNGHLSRAYASNMGEYKNEEFVEGTTDVVRQYLWLFEEHNVMEYLILVGDHLYRMDYEKFIQAHRETDADITVAALPMDEKRATAFGLMKIDEEGRIIEFVEKPKGEQLKAMKVDTTILRLYDERAKEMPYIASMGIYVVSKNVMLNLLRDKFPGANDFGSEVIPGATSIGMRNRSVIALKSDQVGNYRVAFGIVSGCTHPIMGPGKVQAYLYDGYWEDIGTIEAFYNENLGITKKPVPNLSNGEILFKLGLNLLSYHLGIGFSRVVDSKGCLKSRGNMVDYRLVQVVERRGRADPSKLLERIYGVFRKSVEPSEWFFLQTGSEQTTKDVVEIGVQPQ